MLDSIDHRKLLGDDRATVASFLGELKRLTLWIARRRYRFTDDGAEEILLEVVGKLWDKDKAALRAWRGDGSLSTYITSIVHRCCLMELRKRKRRDGELPVEQLDVFPAEREPAAIEAEQLRQTCARALADLPERDQGLIHMRFVEERGYDEITASLEISHGAARKAVHTAVRRLREKMQGIAPEFFGGRPGEDFGNR